MLDDELVIETPERVELHYILANVGNRFLAAAIDHLIQAGAMLITLLIAGALSSWNLFDSMDTWTAAITVLVIFVIIWGYFVAFETLWSGQTPGKRIMRLRVVREDGRPVRFFEVFIRNLLRFLVDLWPWPSYAIGVVSIIFSQRSKRVGDFVAGTVVVKERATEAPSLNEIIRISEIEQQRVERAAPAPFTVDTRLLSDSEIHAIETFLKRRFELAGANRTALAARIAYPIAIKLGIGSGQQISPEAVLEEIERQHRAQSRYFE
ncbi:MAG TPA: RDD family protein [Blastocatellia bacterium]|nr:RDD family protein [Blastocatellia bacterium]